MSKTVKLTLLILLAVFFLLWALTWLPKVFGQSGEGDGGGGGAAIIHSIGNDNRS
jgi:hypothetical protein